VDVDRDSEVHYRSEESEELLAEFEGVLSSDLLLVGLWCVCGSTLLDALCDKGIMFCLCAVVGGAGWRSDRLFT
jgi:hypothetical protein